MRGINRYPGRHLVFGIVLIIVGLLLAFSFAESREKFVKQCTGEVYGKAVSVTRTSRPRRGYDYNVTIEFEVDGRKYTEDCTSSSKVKEGESLRVCYDPDDPSVCYIPAVESSPFMIRLGGGFCAIVGLVMSIKALTVMSKSKAT